MNRFNFTGIKKLSVILVLILIPYTLFSATIILKTGTIMQVDRIQETDTEYVVSYKGQELTILKVNVFRFSSQDIVSQDMFIEIQYDALTEDSVLTETDKVKPEPMGPDTLIKDDLVTSIYKFRKAESMVMRGTWEVMQGFGFQFIEGELPTAACYIASGSYWVSEFFSVNLSGNVGVRPSIVGSLNLGARLHFPFAKDIFRPYISLTLGVTGYEAYREVYDYDSYSYDYEYNKDSNFILGVSGSLLLITMRKWSLDLGYAQLYFSWGDQYKITQLPSLSFSMDIIRVGYFIN